jgi:hypothetical protein
VLPPHEDLNLGKSVSLSVALADLLALTWPPVFDNLNGAAKVPVSLSRHDTPTIFGCEVGDLTFKYLVTPIHYRKFLK